MQAFVGCNQLTEVNLSEGITEIGSMAFSGCSSLSNIDLPKSLLNIYEYAFEMTSIQEVNAADTLAYIYNGAYPIDGTQINIAKTTRIGLHNFPDLNIEEYVVEDISNHTWGVSVDFSDDGVISMAGYPDNTIETVTIAEGIEYIGMETFKGFPNLKTVVLPSTIKLIDIYAFEDCSSLVDINFPEGLIKIGDYAFRNCTSLKNPNFPETLVEIGDGAYENCTFITEFHIPE